MQNQNFNHSTLADCPELMGVICNIQNIAEKCIPDYDRFAHFESLKHMESQDLHNLQDALISPYNKVVQAGIEATNILCDAANNVLYHARI